MTTSTRERPRPWLLERERELAAATGAIEELRHGSGATVLIRGPAGIGKTALLEAHARIAAGAGLRSVTARASAIERAHTFGIVHQLVEPLVRDAPADRDPFTGAARHARTLLDGGPDGAADDGGPPSYAVLHGLYWLVVQLADAGPLALLVDDVQLADEASLRWLSFVGRRLSGVPVLLVLTHRPEPRADASPALAEVLALDHARVLAPSPLSDQASERLAGRVLGREVPQAVGHALGELTGGNPFLVAELARALCQAGRAGTELTVAEMVRLGAPAISRRLAQHLDSLPPAAAALARAASICGRDVAPAIVAEVAGLSTSDATDAAADLREAGLLAAGPGFAFAHPLTEAAVDEGMPARERASLHARAATALAADGQVDRAATHLLEVQPGGDAPAARTLLEAGRRAARGGATKLAKRLLQRGLAEPPAPEDRPSLLLSLGQAELESGEADLATGPLRMALDAARDPVAEASAATHLCRALGAAGRYEDAVDVVRTTLERLDGTDTDAAERLEARMLVDAAFVPPLWTRLAQRAERLHERPARTPEGQRARAAVLAILAAYRCRPEVEIVSLAEEALAGGDRFAGSGLDVDATSLAVTALVRTRRWRLSASVLDQGLAVARERVRPDRISTILNLRGQLGVVRGDLDGARADATQQLGLGIAGVAPLVALSVLVEVLVEQGRLDEASRLLVERRLTGEVPDALQANYLLHARGRLRAAAGDRELALQDLLEAGRRATDAGDEGSVIVPWRSSAAHVLVALDRREQARALAGEELRFARAIGAPVPLGLALHAAARASDDGEQAMALLEQAIAALAEGDAPLLRARVLVDRGTALRRVGHPGPARAALREALRLADERGAERVAAKAAEELAAAGGRPSLVRRRSAPSLTPQQLRVAQLAADGLTNRLIAQELFLTEKTVEGHLAGAYRALGIAARAELAAALAAIGGDGRGTGTG